LNFSEQVWRMSEVADPGKHRILILFVDFTWAGDKWKNCKLLPRQMIMATPYMSAYEAVWE